MTEANETQKPGTDLLTARMHLAAVALHEERLTAEAKTTPLSSEELKLMAEEFPQWEVMTGICGREPVKYFKRTLSDVPYETYETKKKELGFDDIQFFDGRLRSIFSGEYGSVSRVLGATAEETMNMTSLKIEARATTPSITVYDYLCVEEAERYLEDKLLRDVGLPPAHTEPQTAAPYA